MYESNTPRPLDADPQFRPVAKYSPDLLYRWWWEERWGDGPYVCWIGLNPGTGDTDGKPRPTLRRMRAWTEGLGHSALVIVNLFAFRTTYPKELRAAARDGIDIIGDENDETIREWSSGAAATVGAWGAGGRLLCRGAQVAAMVPDLLCLGLTGRGEPRHPLYVPSTVETIGYRPR